MERETFEIVTPVSNQKVKLYSWLTGRERRAIRSVFLEGVKFSSDDAEEKENAKYDIAGSVVTTAQDKSIETIVVSIDDDTKDVLNRVLDMREKDFDFVMESVNKVSGGLSEEDKKK